MPEDNERAERMAWNPGDLKQVPEAEIAIIEMTVGGISLTIKQGVIESSDPDLVALGEELLEGFLPEYGDPSIWMASVLEEVADAVMVKAHLPGDTQ